MERLSVVIVAETDFATYGWPKIPPVAQVSNVWIRGRPKNQEVRDAVGRMGFHLIEEEPGEDAIRERVRGGWVLWLKHGEQMGLETWEAITRAIQDNENRPWALPIISGFRNAWGYERFYEPRLQPDQGVFFPYATIDPARHASFSVIHSPIYDPADQTARARWVLDEIVPYIPSDLGASRTVTRAIWLRRARQWRRALRVLAPSGKGLDVVGTFDPLESFERARNLEKIGRISEAIHLMEHVMTVHDQFWEGWLLLGHFALNHGELGRALRAFSRLAVMETMEEYEASLRHAGLLGRAAVLEALGNAEEAYEAYRAAYLFNPEFTRPLYRMAEIGRSTSVHHEIVVSGDQDLVMIDAYLTARRYREALRLIRRVLKKSGIVPELVLLHGMALLMNGKPEAALQAFKRVPPGHDLAAQALRNAWRASWVLDEWPESLALMRRMRKVGRANPVMYRAMRMEQKVLLDGGFFSSLRLSNRAAESLGREVLKSVDVFLACGRPDLAERLSFLFRIIPWRAGYRALGTLFFLHRQYALALKALDHAPQPTTAQHAVELAELRARAYAARGETHLASEHFVQAWIADRNQLSVYRHAGEFFRSEGQKILGRQSNQRKEGGILRVDA